MGAWEAGTFANDDASDWLDDLATSRDTSVIAAALDIVTNAESEYLEAPDCANGLAAAEILAALRGHPVADLPEHAAAWVEAHQISTPPR